MTEDVSLPIEQLLTAQLPALRIFLRHKVGEALARKEAIDDLAQSVCREVLQDQTQLRFTSEEKFRAYLFLQAVRKVTDRARFHAMDRRDQRRERRLPDESRSAAECGIYSSLATGSQIACAREHIALVERCLTSLPEAQREALLLSRVAGLSYAEIAQQRGVAEATIRGLAARGLARLCVELERPAT